ncbi:FkbM family methyltransferase [Chloroflexota bacterium]
MKKMSLSVAAWMARVLPTPIKRGLYRFKPLAGLIRTGLNRAAPQGLAEVSVAAGGLAGGRLMLDLQREKDYWLGTYEPELQAAIAEFVQPGMIAYDVGANIGYISLLLARQVGERGRVWAFEALPANFERLSKNIALNIEGARVQAVAAAIVERKRAVRFFSGPSGAMGKADGSAGRRESEGAAVLDIEGLSLDFCVYVNDYPAPDVVKIDIEGGEVLALPGMERILIEARPLILLELHGPQAAEATWLALKKAGYRICQMGAGYPEVESLEVLDWKAYLAAFPQDKRSNGSG